MTLFYLPSCAAKYTGVAPWTVLSLGM